MNYCQNIIILLKREEKLKGVSCSQKSKMDTVPLSFDGNICTVTEDIEVEGEADSEDGNMTLLFKGHGIDFRQNCFIHFLVN